MELKISRREFINLGATGMAATVLPSSVLSANKLENTAPGSVEQANMILIMADDLGYGDIGCYGNEGIKTPNLDALAAAGMKFTDFHSNAPVCSPTRAALLTGRYQQRCGVEEVVYAKGPARQTGMALSELTFAEVLKSAGYVTGIFGKWHLGYNVQFNPTRQGFDEFIGYVSGNVDYHSHIDGAGVRDWWNGDEKMPEEGYVTDLITRHGMDFIKKYRDRPFCLYLAHEAPHYPYQGRDDTPERLDGGRKGRKAKGTEIARAYKEMVETMDEGIGRVITTLRELGLERKTFVFFCSDNGATKNGCNGPLAGYKGSLWEGGHRVPAIAYWPGKIGAGTLTSETALSMDLFPTMVSIAGASVPAGFKLDGVNFLPMLTQGSKLPNRATFWRYRQQRAVRRGPWKLLVQGQKVGLYNLDEDIGEKKNLAGAKLGMVKALEGELSAWERDVSARMKQKS
jgi:arylsulfatase A